MQKAEVRRVRGKMGVRAAISRAKQLMGKKAAEQYDKDVPFHTPNPPSDGRQGVQWIFNERVRELTLRRPDT